MSKILTTEELFKTKVNLADLLTDVSVDTEGLFPGQTPIRDTKLSEGGRVSSRFKDTVQGISIDWDAWEKAPADRKNFYYVSPDKVPVVIKKQYQNYFRNPSKYGLSDDSTIEDVIKTFDKQNPANKIKIIQKNGVDIKTKIKDVRDKFDLSELNPFHVKEASADEGENTVFSTEELFNESKNNLLSTEELFKPEKSIPQLISAEGRPAPKASYRHTDEEVMQFQTERMADRIFTHATGLTPEQGIKAKQDFSNVMLRAPRLGLAMTAPFYAVAIELAQQGRNALVSSMKKEKYSPKEFRLISELLPKGTPGVVQFGVNLVESLGEAALLGAAGNLAKQGLLKQTFKELGEKLEKAGYGTGKVPVNMEALKEAVKGSTLEKEAMRLIKAKNLKIPVKEKIGQVSPEQTINVPSVIPKQPVTPSPTVPIQEVAPLISPKILAPAEGKVGLQTISEVIDGKEYMVITGNPIPGAKVKYAPQYSVSEEEYRNIIKGEPLDIKPPQKIIPPATATGEPIEWEKSVPWQVNLGRNITGIFEREIGPKLQISSRFKKWLGVYYPMLGPSGTIRVVSLASEQTLNHETGHFLDDALGKFPIEKRGDIRNELLKTTKYLRPFEESYEPVIDKETGLPKIGKKGKELKKQTAYTAYRRSRSEIFADYVSLYISDPIKAKELAPKFTEIVEKEIAKDKEFAYIVKKMREFEMAFKPVKDFVNSVRKIPDIVPMVQDWENKGTLLYNIWTKPFGELIYNKLIKEPFDKFSLTPLGRELAEKKGLSDRVFEILRQRKKLIDGQRLRLKEELIDPLSKIDKEGQEYISESLQRWESMGEDHPLRNIREEARKELAVWANEARKLGLLNDEVFWNNTGQYFPFMYSSKEFENNKVKLGYFPSKQLRANLSGFKHRLTDEEMGREYFKAILGTWPSSMQKINSIPTEILIAKGRQAREEMGLMKESASYVLQKRISQMIEAVYTVKAFNQIAKIPGVVGAKGLPGFSQMPQGKKYGDLSGAWVPENLVKEINTFNQQVSEWGKVFGYAVSAWKALKVPWDTAVFTRNIVTNMMMGYLHNIPVWNPLVILKGLNSAITKNEVYKNLRDNGLFRHTYSQAELENLAGLIKENPNNVIEHIFNFGIRVFKTPGDFYGYVEDISKLSIANWVVEQGADVAQAIKLSDKILFDYSSVSSAVGKLRKGPFPLFTWSAKVLPRLIETGIKNPEKYLLLISLIAIANEINRRRLGITKDEEENLKPEYLRGQTTLLGSSRDINGDINYIDLTYFLPWGGWIPSRKGKFGVPQTLTIGNPAMTWYNAYVLNYDPFYGEIAKDYMTEEESSKARKEYMIKSLGPKHFVRTPFEITKSVKGVPDRLGRKSELSKVLSGEFLGVKYNKDISAALLIIRRKIIKNHQNRIFRYNDQYKAGEINLKEREELIKKSIEYMQQELRTH